MFDLFKLFGVGKKCLFSFIRGKWYAEELENDIFFSALFAFPQVGTASSTLVEQPDNSIRPNLLWSCISHVGALFPPNCERMFVMHQQYSIGVQSVQYSTAGGPAWEEESRLCAPPPVASSALAHGDQTLIRQANHPVGIGERDCGIGELLPELGLVLRARCCHDRANRRRDLSQVTQEFVHRCKLEGHRKRLALHTRKASVTQHLLQSRRFGQIERAWATGERGRLAQLAAEH